MAIQPARDAGLEADRVVDMEGASSEEVFAGLLEAVGGDTLIVGMGNIKGIGEDLSARFREASS